jgi:hypothetical protein
MKKLVLIMIVLAGAQAGYAQLASGTPKADMAVAAFTTQNHDFGKIKQGVPVTHKFEFTNNGSVPLIITNVQASCGCTTPNWSKEPVAPGSKGFIEATFNAGAVGAFNKAVTMTANVEGGVTQLIIKGEVLAPAPNN